MQTKFITEEFLYDGSQLRPLYAYQDHGVEGESTIAWVGACNVSNENMKDGEDLFAGESIEGQLMLHFIIELFEQPLFSMVAVQRLFSSIAKDCLEELSSKKIARDGDDLFFNGGKLSISIASRDAVSSMIHFAINVNNDGTPVKTASLDDLGIESKDLVERLFESWSKEYSGIQRATKKVFALK